MCVWKYLSSTIRSKFYWHNPWHMYLGRLKLQYFFRRCYTNLDLAKLNLIPFDHWVHYCRYVLHRYGGYKIFDSHSRDAHGMAHPQGTCVCLLKKYFQTLHTNSDSLFELRGIKIDTDQCYDTDTLIDQPEKQSNRCNINHHYAHIRHRNSPLTS